MIVKIDLYREIKSGLSPYLFLTHVQTQVGVRKLALSLVHMHVYIGKGKFVSMLAQYPVFWNAKALHTLLPWQTYPIKHHLNLARKHSATQQLMRDRRLNIHINTTFYRMLSFI